MIWVRCVAAAGDRRGDYWLGISGGMPVRRDETGMYQVWSDGGKHQVSADFSALLDVTFHEAAIEAAEAEKLSAEMESSRG